MDVYSAKGIMKVRLIPEDELYGITVVIIDDTARIYVGTHVEVRTFEEVES